MRIIQRLAPVILTLCSCSSVVVVFDPTGGDSGLDDESGDGSSSGHGMTSTSGGLDGGSSGSTGADAGSDGSTESTGAGGTTGVGGCALPQTGFPCIDALNLATSISCGDDVLCISVVGFVYGLGPQPLIDVATCSPSHTECPAAWSACEMITGSFCFIHTDTTAQECADAFLVNGPADESMVLATCQAIIDSM